MSPIRLYRLPLSGHCHRVELFLSILRLPVELVDADAETRKSAEFLSRNALGQIPVIEDGDVTLADSNSILVYLAGKYDASERWYPRDPLVAAQIQRFLSIAAGQIAYGPCAARLVKLFGMDFDHARSVRIAHGIFGFLDGHLAGRQWLVGASATIADLSIYSYTAHAPEGGVDLAPYANLRAWLERVESLPGFVPMKRSAAPV